MRGAAVAAAIVWALTVASARAQDGPRAEAEFNEATRQFEARNHRLALAGFERSYVLMEGDARAQVLILFNIGRAQEELGMFDAALQSFERYRAEAPADAPFMDEVRDRVRELRARAAASDDRLLIAGGTVLGVGAAAAIAALVTGLLALEGEAALEGACEGGECPAGEADRLSETRTLSIATDVLWITGASVVAAGAALLAIGLVQSETTVVAACDANGCGASVRGRF